jgi:uncharacterized membrane protein YagU involved in acid resistance
MASSDQVSGPPVRSAALLAVLSGGWIAGTLDIASACLINSLPPRVILQAIASGVLGAGAFHDGFGAALAGLLLQWAMALMIAGIYVAALLRWPRLGRHPLAGGVAYGFVIYGVMNYVVVPLSAAPFGPPAQPLKRLENLLAMMVFGLIVAAAARLAGVSGSARRAAPGP